MPGKPNIMIGGRIYRRIPEVDRYQIPFAELGDLLMRHIPAHSHVEIVGIQMPDGYESEVYALNSGDEGELEYLQMYGGVTFKVDKVENLSSAVARLRRAFPDRGEHTYIPNPNISTHERDGGFLANAHLSLDFKDAPDTLVRDAFTPFLEGFERLRHSDIHLFICYASEDKSIAHEIASSMKDWGPEVWFDEWEIRVGDSIVQKISDALGTVTHLVVLLSSHSVSKPWVKKELSAALMRQLSRESITVLPMRLDDCHIPPILADIKYADARDDIPSALKQIERAVFLSAE